MSRNNTKENMNMNKSMKNKAKKSEKAGEKAEEGLTELKVCPHGIFRLAKGSIFNQFTSLKIPRKLKEKDI